MRQPKFALSGLATAVGSMPHRDAEEACSLVLAHLPEIPAWPQLPKRSFRENMYVQFSEGFPGVVLEGEHIYVDRSRDLSQPLEELYARYLANDIADYGVGRDYANGLHCFLAGGVTKAVKGQVTGPVSWGLAVTDQDRRPLLYDEVLADAIGKHLRMKAAWQERALGALSANTIMFIDEPYLASVGSAFVSVSPAQVTGLLEEVFRGLRGLKGVHCCGNTDWSLLLGTSLDILNFDAYNYGQSLSLYPEEVRDFLHRGGVIAWGIVPNEEQALAGETVASLVHRLRETMGLLTSKGIPQDALLEQCLVTPCCGLASLSPEGAERALELLAGVSRQLRKRVVGGSYD